MMFVDLVLIGTYKVLEERQYLVDCELTVSEIPQIKSKHCFRDSFHLAASLKRRDIVKKKMNFEK